MRKVLFLFFIGLLFVGKMFFLDKTLAQTVSVVPHPTKNYNQSATQWWNTHPYNPQTTANNYIPVGGITSPSPVINVCNYKTGSDTAGIEQALAQLPASGGTLSFPSSCGPYVMTKPLNWVHNVYPVGFSWVGNGTNLNITQKNNIHFVGDSGKPTIVGSMHITSNQFRLNQPVKFKPVKNFYFKNLTFQTTTAPYYAVIFEDAEDILFDNVTFDNTGVYNVINGNNFFVRNSTIKGTDRPGVHFDGSHFSGIINSTYESNLHDLINFQANWDVTQDQDLNGTLDEYENRQTRYVVIANNTIKTFSTSSTATIAIGAPSDVLMTGNTVSAPANAQSFLVVNSDNRPFKNTTTYFDSTGYTISNNTLTNIRNIFELTAPDYVKKGDIAITNNNANSVLQNIFYHPNTVGTITAPVTICGNKENGVLDPSNTACSSSPSSTPLPTTAPLPSGKKIYYGVFEDGQWQTNDVTFTNTINDLKAHAMDAIAFTNTQGNLSVSDNLNFNVIAAPMKVLYDSFYKSSAIIDLATARTLLYPVVDALRTHPSLIGYNIHDDSIPGDNAEMEMITQVFEERDSIHPVSELLIIGQLAQEVYDYLKPKAFMSYDFPFKTGTTACQVFRNNKDWVYSMRESFQLKPKTDPMWFVLQAHQTVNTDGSPAGLRQPTPEEMSLQFWEALGEEATGLFWYTYTNSLASNGGLQWTGIKNLPSHYAMAKTLGENLNTLRPYLINSQKIPDRFKVAGSNYISTLKHQDGTYYIIVVNQSCIGQNLTVSSDYFNGSLKDVLTNQTFNMGSGIPFTAGGGRMFQIVNPTAKTPPATQANLIQNASFETQSNGKPTLWTLPSGADQIASDTTQKHSGTSSVKIGPGGSRTSQNITLQPNTYYYFSYWIKADNLNNNSVGMKIYELSPVVQELTNVSWKQTGTYDWVKRVGFFKTPSDFSTGRVDITWGLNSGQTIWIDDVTLCRMDQPCPDEYLIERLGSSTPPPTVKPGDANNDNKVDGLDYVIWLNRYNQSVSGSSNGDFNNDNKVDGLDYIIWVNNYNT